MGSRRWAVRESGRAAPPKHRETCEGVDCERSSSEFETKMWEERRALRSRLDLWDRGDLVLPRVGSLHYLCGHCGHAGHSLLVRDQQRLKPRSEHNLLRSDHDLLRDQKMLRPKSLHSSFDLINPNSIVVPANVRRKKKRRRPIQAVPPVSPPEHEYESLVSSPGSSCTAGSGSQMQTLDVRIKVTRAVIRESGQFETEGGSSEGDRRSSEVIRGLQRSSEGDQRSFSETSGRAENGFGSVYDNITVRDGQDDDSWQYQAKIPQDYLIETGWKGSSEDMLRDTGQQEEMAVLGPSDQENRRPRLKMFKLKCLNKVASFSIFK